MHLVEDHHHVPIPGGETVPILIARDAARSHAGIVLVYHGLMANKDGQRKELHSLAASGFLAVGVDARFHGERAHSDLRGWLNEGDTHRNFLTLVRDCVAEIPTLVDILTRELGERQGRVGICGISMGGYIAYRAALVDRRLRACVPILGSPDWSLHSRHTDDRDYLDLLSQSPHHHPGRFPPTALLAINAGLDENVLPGESRQFVHQLRRYYGDMPERLEYREYPESGHFMREHDWHDAWSSCVGWFRRFLG